MNWVYLIVLADEIFGRNNRRFIATFKQASATGHKAINPGCVTTTNFILAYSKSKNWNPNKLYTPRKERNKRYDNFIKNREGDPSNWEIVTLKKAFSEHFGVEVKNAANSIDNYEAKLDEFVLANAKAVIQLVHPNYDKVSKTAKETY